MTDLEIELRELLIKYNINVCEVSILFSNTNRNTLAISFEEATSDNEQGKPISNKCR